MSVIEQYWEGVVDRLQAEVNVLSRLIDHAGERGRENEQVLQRVLERFLPRVYGLGTGLVIDSAGNSSRQMDLVIFDQQHHPTWLGQTTMLLHPVETVYAVVEVKTTLRSGDIDDIKRKCRSVRELSFQADRIMVQRDTGEAIAMGSRQIEPPLVAALAYSSDVGPATIESRFAEAELIEQPDLMCVLRSGLVAGKKLTTAESPLGRFEANLVLLQLRDENGTRLGDVFIEPKGEAPPPDLLVQGRRYPVLNLEEGWACTDPARAFVLFLMALTELLSDHVIDPRPILRRYVPVEFDRIVNTTGADEQGKPTMDAEPLTENPRQ